MSGDETELAGPPRRAERRQLEPFEVPTSGAFFMHDDRFGGDDAPPPCVLTPTLSDTEVP